MNLPFDILRHIVLISRINEIKDLCLVNKSFYSLCCERNLWLEKFKEKNLLIIDNDKINNASQYINEYRKVSYSSYTANCLINMIGNKYHITFVGSVHIFQLIILQKYSIKIILSLQKCIHFLILL